MGNEDELADAVLLPEPAPDCDPELEAVAVGLDEPVLSGVSEADDVEEADKEDEDEGDALPGAVTVEVADCDPDEEPEE